MFKRFVPTGNLVAASLLVLCSGCRHDSTAAHGQSAQRTAPTTKDTGIDAHRNWLRGASLIDLTHPFDEHTIYWPTAAGFRLETVSRGRTEAGYFYAANRFSAAEHGGTHIDAPIHFFDNQHTVDQIPLERLVGEGILVDVSERCRKDRDYRVGVDDLRAWEKRHGRPLSDVIVLLRTGFSRYWPDAERYLGTAAKGPDAISQLHFPGLAPEAAKWLVEHRSILAIGIDTASIDYGQSRRFQSHVTLFEHNIPALENVAHLDQLPESGFTVAALPIKIAGGTGGPARIVAILPP